VDRRIRHDLDRQVTGVASQTAWLPALPAVAAGALFAGTLLFGGDATAGAQPVDGRRLYQMQCASCHAADGNGVEDRGPSLEREGRASVDFVLRTGRMPLPDSDRQPRRRPVQLAEQEIAALVDYAGEFGDGPDIPDVDPRRGSLPEGGALYQLNCAACHVASGAGASIGAGGVAPSLMESTPVQVGEAVLVGPGAMPVFGAFDGDDIDDVAAYVEQLQDEDATGVGSLGGVGPVAEGLAAWVLGLLALVAFARWIGSPASHDDDAILDASVVDRAEGGT
jgi:ubiquinol-cytochrome c reductase cytochrome c subunit